MSNQVDSTPFVSEQSSSRPKRIIVCCDGTWQSSTSLDPKRGIESNVARIARVLAKAGTDANGKTWEQVVYYDAGVGTGDLSSLESRVRGKCPSQTDEHALTIHIGGLGIGLAENVVEAYNFIVNNYKKGDELFFFGFSRGTYTVRAAAGFVGQFGIVRPHYMKDFVKCYAEYMSTDHGRPRFEDYPPWLEFQKNNPDVLNERRENAIVQVIGVWDTVGALGIPELGYFWQIRSADTKYYQFYDTNLNSSRYHLDFTKLFTDIYQQLSTHSRLWLWTNEDQHSTQQYGG